MSYRYIEVEVDYEAQLADAKAAHIQVSEWLLEAEAAVRTLGPSYERDCRVVALTAERRRLVACYMEAKRALGLA